ncbi:hypothetical protein TNCV_3250031 [Trichonephila clavipes]|nr:hypothetical protein TNCV_3250031 [Trichonephila clavipes]
MSKPKSLSTKENSLKLTSYGMVGRNFRYVTRYQLRLAMNNYHTHLEEEYANYRKPPDGADSVRDGDSRSYGIFADKIRTIFRLRETQRYRNRYLSPSQVDSRDGRTFTQPQEFFQRLVPIEHTGHDQEKGGNANASCTTIGPPLQKSRPTLQAQVSKTKKIRVPDRGLKAAGAA